MGLTAVDVRSVPTLFEGFHADAERRRKIVLCARELRKLAVKRRALSITGELEWGVTADDTHAIAVRLGFATGAERNKRELSWYAAVPRVARLRRTERIRAGRSRNSHRVYVA